ncbi:MAG: hypothetical protein KKA05_03380 [Alphaproteobacteria bacterium]|nr:hypothetical protein [Alphaproteobacteria bacterium]MBU0858765.1 hypothetical protein [Alphaproteobacteria bacterium]
MAERIGDKFTKAAKNTDPVVNGTRAGAVVITRALYDAYLDQYNLSQKLARDMEEVMNHREHAMIMEEGRVLRYALPDEEGFLAEMNIYRDFLNSFNPHDVLALKDGRVRVPLRTARGLHFMGEYNRELVDHVLLEVLRTEYLRRFTDLKEAGIPYAGPTALQQTVDVLSAHTRTAREEARSRSVTDWPRFAP